MSESYLSHRFAIWYVWYCTRASEIRMAPLKSLSIYSCCSWLLLNRIKLNILSYRWYVMEDHENSMGPHNSSNIIRAVAWNSTFRFQSNSLKRNPFHRNQFIIYFLGITSIRNYSTQCQVMYSAHSKSQSETFQTWR